MKKLSKLSSIVLPSLLIAFGVSASATTLTMTNNVLMAGTDPTGGFGGEFSGLLNGSTPISVFCVDFSDNFLFDHTYTVNVNSVPPPSAGFSTQTHLGGLPTTSFEYFNNAATGYSAAVRYELAGYLTTQYSGTTSSPANNAIQEAIWTLLDASTALSYNCNNTATACGADIANDFSSLGTFLASNIVNIYTDATAGCAGTPTVSGCMQEFVTVSPTTATPEPSSMSLMGIGGGLIGLGMLGRKLVKE